MFRPLIISSLLAVLALQPAPDARTPDPDLLSVRFTNGTVAKVRVLGLEETRVDLREIVFDGGMDVRHTLDEFEPSSAFRIELAARRPGTPDEHAAMARRAAELELPQFAVEQAGEALQLLRERRDDTGEEQLRTWLVGVLEGWLRDALDRGDLAEANRYLRLIATRHANLLSEPTLGELAHAVDALERDRAAARRAERQAKLDERARADIERRLEPIREEIRRGDELYLDAVRISAEATRSAELAEEAVESYRDAWKAASKLHERHPGDAALVVEIESIANHLHDHAILAGLHAADLLAVRSDYYGALEWVDTVLAIDPEHAEAQEMKRTILVAKSAAAAWLNWGPAGR